ncbi:hybrid sensor histidine kinase/response regulator [Cystobacter fuscus]|uniref:histidine kinase n=1 Tax=Cystobacter fuscus TaxID=43 RepID=A0A250IXX6_9BACT|nr:response regulator [Cystobacter fuscus]ATB36595.1 hybrid sensor histidine kinase/response regulator [Cystobacter fuscus]
MVAPWGAISWFRMSDMIDSQKLFDSAPAPLMVLDRELKYVAANQAYLRATSLRRDEIIGRNLFEVLPQGSDPADPDGAGKLRESLERVLASRMPDLLAMAVQPIARPGEGGPVLEKRVWTYSHKPLLDSTGNVAFILQHAVDVTDLRTSNGASGAKGQRLEGVSGEQLASLLGQAWTVQENNKELDYERRYLRQLIDLLPGVVGVLRGPDYVFDMMNANYLPYVGFRDVIGLPLLKARPELTGNDSIFDMLRRVFHQGETISMKGFNLSIRLKKDGPIENLVVDFEYRPVRVSGGPVMAILIYGQDVTEKAKAEAQVRHYQEHLEQLVRERTRALEESEAERRKTEEQLRQSQKMEAVGKLTGGVAHDFNNLLQVIAGNLQLLQRDVGGNERALHRVQTATRAVERGAKLASQLLSFARRQPLQPIVVNLSRLVRGMDELLRRTLGEDVELETVTAGGLWNTAIDPNQLENVILNLAINARDAMSNNGKLTIEVSNAVLDDRYCRMHPEVLPGQYVLLAVSDTGSGMTPEVMERAFEPFFTTKPEGRGTGLGLSMVYGFVKQSGGHIKLYSELGHGTTIKLYMPRAVEAESMDAQVITGPIEGGSETILVVEDDPEVRTTVVEMVSELGYRVLKAVDAQSALVILQSGVPIELLFTDVVMPGPVRSPELAKQAKALHPDIEVLFTSGYTENAIVHGGRLDPGVQLLSKPYSRDDLARKLRQLLNGRQQRLAVRGAARVVPTSPASPAPAAPSPKPPTASSPASAPAPSASRRLRVLLVEDDEDVRSSACELMDLLGHEVLAVTSAEEAKGALAASGFDVLFTDVTLPGASGVDLAREVAGRKTGIKIILASGHGHVALPRGEAPLEGVVVLPKPYALPQIQAALEQAVALP